MVAPDCCYSLGNLSLSLFFKNSVIIETLS